MRALVRSVIIVIVAMMAILAYYHKAHTYITLENLQAQREYLTFLVAHHYGYVTLAYCALYIAITTLLLPITTLATLTGGFLFGTFVGSVYSCIAATIGGTLGFLMVRYLIGHSIQRRYHAQLASFNAALQHNEIEYLLIIHFIAVIPFPLINLLAGLTHVSTWRFIWTTFVGIIPGAIVYSFAGQQLSEITNIKDISSSKVLVAFGLLILFALVPIVLKRRKNR